MATAHDALKAAQGKPSDDDFHYTEDGFDFVVPSMAKLDPSMDALAVYEDNGSLSNTLALVRSGLDDELGVLLGKMRTSQFAKFADMWSDHSGVTPGNLHAS